MDADTATGLSPEPGREEQIALPVRRARTGLRRSACCIEHSLGLVCLDLLPIRA